MQVWRITNARHAATAFTGEGARRSGARWHKAGIPTVYTATSLALASLEVFVNLDPLIDPPHLVLIPAEVPGDLLHERIEQTQLPGNWRDVPSPVCRAMGGEWFQSRRSVALMVPSAAVMGEWNVLLNPEHADFARVTVGEPQAFRFDARMFRRE